MANRFVHLRSLDPVRLERSGHCAPSIGRPAASPTLPLATALLTTTPEPHLRTSQIGHDPFLCWQGSDASLRERPHRRRAIVSISQDRSRRRRSMGLSAACRHGLVVSVIAFGSAIVGACGDRGSAPTAASSDITQGAPAMRAPADAQAAPEPPVSTTNQPNQPFDTTAAPASGGLAPPVIHSAD